MDPAVRQTIKVLDKGYIRLDAYQADDLAVANAARVSFNDDHDVLDERDQGLIGFLMREHHGTPFEHGYFRFIVKAPLFVVREHHRHRAGHSYNEWSGRYSTLEPEFYVPEYVRTQVGKPGAYTFEAVPTQTAIWTRYNIEQASKRAYQTYTKLLEEGIAREVARMVLPLNIYTKYYWSCNPRSLMHFLGLRGADDAQWEIRQYAEAAEKLWAAAMPVTYAAWQSLLRVTP